MFNTAHMAECLQEAHHFGFYRHGALANAATHVRAVVRSDPPRLGGASFYSHGSHSLINSSTPPHALLPLAAPCPFAPGWRQQAPEAVTQTFGFDWKAIKDARDAYVYRLNGIYDRLLKNSGVDVIHGVRVRGWVWMGGRTHAQGR